MKKTYGAKILSWCLTAGLVLGLAYPFFVPSAGKRAVLAPARFPGEALIIDPGHGGKDGGAVSPRGTIESGVNLAIALRLDGILGLYGVNVRLLRETDISLHDSDCVTLRQMKISDLRNRVAQINATENATLLSIHQNSYPREKYHGAQVFYGNEPLSLPLAQLTQALLRQCLDPENKRLPTQIPSTVYLMKHISCPGILVECGFLSNEAEEEKLTDDTYQKKLSATLAGAYLQFQHTKGVLPDEG